MPQFDFIIIGAGASGLLLANAMGKEPFFEKKSILLLEKDAKNTNDRTWCFWEKGTGDFDNLLHASWSTIYFAGQDLKRTTPIAPYTYKMIRGVDFYHYYLDQLKSCPNITLKVEEVLEVKEKPHGATVRTKTTSYHTPQVFTSIFDVQKVTEQQHYPLLQQHFLGWFVKTEHPIFDPGVATFMDFSIPQKGNTRFMYVLPFSENEALVEYTLFSVDTLEKSTYEKAIVAYLEAKGSGVYEVAEKETGNIPMTSYNFERHNSQHVFHIGIAGGWAKASTGYTFMNTHKKVKTLIEHLKKGRHPKDLKTKTKFWYYDLLLLDILYQSNHLGSSIFESLFKKISPQHIFKFLDEETSLLEDAKIMSAPAPLPFIKALLKRIFKPFAA